MLGVLLTGATGLVGQAVLPRLLATDPATIVHCLLRADDAPALQRRHRSLLADARISPDDHDRVIAVAGNVERPDLAITDIADLAARVDTVVHAAASTKFDLPLDEARAVNVGSVERIVDFARQADRRGGFDRIHHVSSAYVVGDREGEITTPPLDPLGPFRNNYEQSKWEAEQVLRATSGTIAATISRPSIIVGDSRTGATPHFRVLYEPMKWVYANSHRDRAGPASRHTDVLPCRPEVRLDVVPVDFVADAIVGLLRSDDAIGGVFHVSAGPRHAVTIEATVDLMLDAGNEILAASGQRPVPRPRIVSPEMLATDEGLRELFELGEAVMSLYMPYALREQLFDAGGTHAVLRDSLRECPDPHDYYPTLVRYASEKNFGRKPR